MVADFFGKVNKAGYMLQLFRMRILVICLLLFGLIGCAAQQPVSPEKVLVNDTQIIEQLAGRLWVAEYIHGRPVVDMSHSSMVFTTDGRVSGRGGCNAYSGSYSLKDGKLTFSALAATMKMCAPALNDQETRFFRSLGGVQSVGFENGLLRLLPEGGQPSIYAEQGLE